MKFSIKYIAGILMTGLVLTSCEKKVPAIQESFSVNVEYKNSGSKYLTGDIELNPKDSVFFDFTITANEDMAVVEIQRNNAKIDTFNVPAGSKRSFSNFKKYRSDSIPGDYTYRILARNAAGVFLGDGDKKIKVTIKSDFNFWSYRFLYVPDSVAKTNKTYYAATTGATYSYSEGAANSAAIDFGFFYDTTTIGAPKHTIYALNASTFTPYDLSTWTKNATIFKKVASPTLPNLTSGSAIRAAGIANLGSGTTSKITQLAGGNYILFKTAAGKYGIIQISFIDGATAEKTTNINIDVKIEK